MGATELRIEYDGYGGSGAVEGVTATGSAGDVEFPADLLLERLFGVIITNSDGRTIPVRFIGEQHVKEDLGRIPTAQDWLEHLAPAPWMMKRGRLLHVSEAETHDADSTVTDECGTQWRRTSALSGFLIWRTI